MARPPLAWLCLSCLAACAADARPVARAPSAGAAPPIWRVVADPTVRGARLVPESLDPGTSFGADPGGGVRYLAAGLRVLRLPGGATRTSAERFAGPVRPFVVPARLGGGFLFVAGATVSRSESWLAPTRPVFAAPADVTDVWAGLDRVYARTRTGSLAAIDPERGPVGLGPWPRAPSVTSYRALDGWRAAAIGDARGALATFDAGATWTHLDLPNEPERIGAARVDAASAEALEIPGGMGAGADFLFVETGGPGGASTERACFAIAADRPAVKPAACPRRDPPPEPAGALDPARSRSLGRAPLLSAVEDGWPLGDGTALVARDGALGRVRLADGVWLDVRADAFSPRGSRCHALPLLVDAGAPALGIACADPQGRTAFHLADPSTLRTAPRAVFEGARQVLSFGNGAVAVSGGCRGEPGASDGRHCVLARRGAAPAWRETRAPRDAPSARLLVSVEGATLHLVPPDGHLEGAHLAFDDGPAVALAFPPVPPDVRRALESGVWLDGFEEREPGVFGGWVDARGAMLGVTVSLRGEVRVGTFVRDAGAPMVSGRYGLGWSASHRGYETVDGGMTWTALTVPDVLGVPAERACGAVGCTAAGWIRVGWGEAEARAVEPRAALPSPPRPHPRDLDLVCEPAAARDSAAEGKPRADPGFYGAPAPPMSGDPEVVRADAALSMDRSARLGALGRVFAWGPRSEEWARASRWSMQWLWPYGGSRDVRATAAGTSPFATLDAARRALAGSGPGNVAFSLAVGDEPSAALLVGRRAGTVPEITGMFALEADRAPVEVRRADREPFADVDFAARVGGLWYVVTAQGPGEPRAAVLYRVDGADARELARVPRASSDGRPPPPPRLARRTDGRAVGVVVDGPDGLRWIVPVDLEGGGRGEPEPFGPSDLGDRGALKGCADEDDGWVLDTSWNGPYWSAKPRLELRAARRSFALTHILLRVRLSAHNACIERMSGTFESDARPAEAVASPGNPPAGTGGSRTKATFPVSVLRGHSREVVRCAPR